MWAVIVVLTGVCGVVVDRLWLAHVQSARDKQREVYFQAHFFDNIYEYYFPARKIPLPETLDLSSNAWHRLTFW